MHPTIPNLFLLGGLAAVLPAQLPAVPAPATQRPAHYVIPSGWSQHAIGVKFRDGLRVRLRDGALTDLGTGALGGADGVLGRLRGATWSRAHTVAEDELDRLRAIGERNLGAALPDLNLQFRCVLPADVDAAAVVDALNGLACVEHAEALPGMAPPPQGDQRRKQVFAEPPPRGTGSGSLRGVPDLLPFDNLAARGSHARVVDIEYGFDTHPDLQFVIPLGPSSTNPAFNQHGTQVLGILCARDDDVGVTGQVDQAQLWFAPAYSTAGIYQVDTWIVAAAAMVGPGGVVLLEQQIAGPNWNGNPASQFGLVPVEWHPPTWSAIRTATAMGVIVVEAAGNGSQNLDDPVYGGWFSIPHDSGALLVGAGAAPSPTSVMHSRLSFSNYGETVDVQGLGEAVTTTFSSGMWTDSFGGTSSASAIVAGNVALLESVCFEHTNQWLAPAELRAALRRSGTRQAGVSASHENIGPQPDLVRTAVELRVYPGLGFAHGFGAAWPGTGGEGTLPGGATEVLAMAAFDDDGPGPNPTRLYAAGTFTRIGGKAVQNIACWNGAGWQELGAGLAGTVRALCVHDFGGTEWLVAGGDFPGGIAAWNGIGWAPLGTASASVRALASVNGTLCAGGDFTAINGVPVAHVARYSGPGAWSALGAGFDGPVNALIAYDADDTGPGAPLLVAGGSFQSSAGVPMRGIAQWGGYGWQELGGGVDSSVDCLAQVPVANTPQRYLFVGGTFLTVGGTPAPTPGLAGWSGASWFAPGGAPYPTAMTAFEDGADPTLPRQVDLYFVAGNWFYRLDLTTWVTTTLPTSALGPATRCMFAYDEDDDGVEPASLWFGGAEFAGPASSAGVGKLFGMPPVTSTGTTVVWPTGCGGPYRPTIAASVEPVLGAAFTVQFDCLPESLPAMLAGFPQPFPVPLCSTDTCAVGVDPIVFDIGAQSGTWTLPNQPTLVGLTLAFQGIEFLALPYGAMCVPPFFPVNLRTSDTLLMTF